MDFSNVQLSHSSKKKETQNAINLCYQRFLAKQLLEANLITKPEYEKLLRNLHRK